MVIVVFRLYLPGHAQEREQKRHQDHDRARGKNQSVSKQTAHLQPP
jgi:hypothetical protein